MATEVIQAVDPRTGKLGVSYPATAPETVRAVIAAARRARDEEGWRLEAARARALSGLAERLQRRAEPLVETCMAETGLGRARLEGELERTWRQILLFARLIETGAHYEATIDNADPDARPAPRADLRRMMVPIGPVLVFAASNFPFAFSVAGGDTASALAAGCPVICKAHPGHPGTSELVGHEISQALADAGLDPGTFSLVQTASIETALGLVGDDAIEAVAFTGSTGAGRAIFDAAGARERPIPVFAEMGSTNPVVVTGSAVSERGDAIAAALAGAITRDAGQLCTKPGVIMVPRDSADEFRDALREAVLAADTGVMLNQRLYESAVAAVDSLSRFDEVAPVLAEGASQATDGFGLAGAIFATSSAALRENPELRSERFGPISLLVTYEDLDDLLATVDGFEGQLTATLHATSADEEVARKIVEHLLPLAGRLVFDGVPTGVAVTAAMQHGGPYPATTSAAHTSVGSAAIQRFLRPVVWQNAPGWLLPEPLRDGNPLGVPRVVDGEVEGV
jgi:acyl-CoA reductase-like NAD-dependent aldehyde dehydrogenase